MKAVPVVRARRQQVLDNFRDHWMYGGYSYRQMIYEIWWQRQPD